MEEQNGPFPPMMEALEFPAAPKPLVGTIFIVDDETMVTTSIKTMLELETEHRVFCFNSPEEALEKVRDFLPDVVISDFLMPEMDGIKFLQRVKTLHPESTLILLTGYADKESAIQAINTVGIYRYIEKPWDNDELKLNIKNGLERAHLLGDLRKTIYQLTMAQDQLQSYNLQLQDLVEERTRDVHAAYQTLHSIVQNTADGIMTLDESLQITSINAAIERWLVRQGKSTELLGLSIQKVLSLPDRKPIHPFFQKEEPQLVKEALIAEIPVEISISPIPEGGGYVLVLRDIVQRKEIERLRDDFVSTLTHDLRTPLLAAIQTLGFFTDGSLGPLAAKQIELLLMLIQSLREMLGLVNVLLEVYKYESGRQQLILDKVDLRDLIETIGRELQALAQNKEQVLQIQLPETLPSVVGDKQELRRVLVNLMGNALNYTQAGGQIDVTATADDSHLTVTVADNGRGIPAQDIPKLFQRFSQGTSKQRSSGTGLGLYLSRQIVEAHHGRIWVESEEEKGSQFFISLPLTSLNELKPKVKEATQTP